MEDSTLCSAICSKSWILEAVVVVLQDHAAKVSGACASIAKCLQVYANANTTAAKFELSRCLFSCAGCSIVHTCLMVDILHVSYDALCQMHTHTDVVQSLLLGCGD